MSSEVSAAVSLGLLLEEVRSDLVRAGVESARLDSRLLVEAATGMGHAAMIARPETPVSAAMRATARTMARRREAGEPVHRILGWREFYGLRLELSKGVLEPRPDTEALVDLALPLVREVVRREGRADLLDLGTGSGAIALALLAEEAAATALGVDVSADALATARRNAAALGLEDRFRTAASDWFADIDGRFHIIVANPPYIPTNTIATLSPEVRLHDPLTALDGGSDGLDAYRAIAGRAIDFLLGDGHLIVEIGYDQYMPVRGIFENAGLTMKAAAPDLAGRTRILHFAT